MHSAGSGNIASGQQSDHLLMAAAYNGWLAAKLKVCSLPACGSCSNILCLLMALTGFISYSMSNVCDLFCAAVAMHLTRELATCLQTPDCASTDLSWPYHMYCKILSHVGDGLVYSHKCQKYLETACRLYTHAGMWHAGRQAGRASVCPQALPQ